MTQEKPTPYNKEPWILGGCSGRMITTTSGYVGDGFIADVDTKENASLIAEAGTVYHECGLSPRQLLAQRDELLQAARDMLSGWKYIRQNHGDLYGVGWDRAQSKVETAIAKIESTQTKGD